jgi:hypothetical protein
MSINTGPGFIVSVTHFPKTPAESVSGTEVAGQTVVGTGRNIYRRMIAFENQEKRIEIIGMCPTLNFPHYLADTIHCWIPDPKLYALDSNETYVGMSSVTRIHSPSSRCCAR